MKEKDFGLGRTAVPRVHRNEIVGFFFLIWSAGASSFNLCHSPVPYCQAHTTCRDSMCYCNPGYTGSGVGIGSCEACPQSTFKTSSGSAPCSPCLSCGPGLYRVGCGGGSSGDCQACPARTYKSETHAQKCSTCESCYAGQYLDGCGGEHAGECKPCPANTYKPLDGPQQCLSCETCSPNEYRQGCGGTSPGNCASCSSVALAVGVPVVVTVLICVRVGVCYRYTIIQGWRAMFSKGSMVQEHVRVGVCYRYTIIQGWRAIFSKGSNGARARYQPLHPDEAPQPIDRHSGRGEAALHGEPEGLAEEPDSEHLRDRTARPENGASLIAGPTADAPPAQTQQLQILTFLAHVRKDEVNVLAEGQKLQDIKPEWAEFNLQPQPSFETFGKSVLRATDSRNKVTRIIHLAGHANSQGFFFLENDGTGNAKLIPSNRIAELIANTDAVRCGWLDCVVVNACESESLGTELLRAKVAPCVICWRHKVLDSAATEFAVAFYETLFARVKAELHVAGRDGKMPPLTTEMLLSAFRYARAAFDCDEYGDAFDGDDSDVTRARTSAAMRPSQSSRNGPIFLPKEATGNERQPERQEPQPLDTRVTYAPRRTLPHHDEESETERSSGLEVDTKAEPG